MGWKQSRKLAQGRAGACLAKALWASQDVPGGTRCGFMCPRERAASPALELERERGKPETHFSILANEISSNPPLFIPTVIPPLVLASPVQFSFYSCACICK